MNSLVSVVRKQHILLSAFMIIITATAAHTLNHGDVVIQLYVRS